MSDADETLRASALMPSAFPCTQVRLRYRQRHRDRCDACEARGVRTCEGHDDTTRPYVGAVQARVAGFVRVDGVWLHEVTLRALGVEVGT